MWALEDCRHVSGGLERFLRARGERIVRVPPKVMATSRKSARTYGKSDGIDALAVARAALADPDLPGAHEDVAARRRSAPRRRGRRASAPSPRAGAPRR